jgi:hypothetical protein
MNERQKKAIEKISDVGTESQKEEEAKSSKITKSSKSSGKLHKQESGVPATQQAQVDASAVNSEDFPLLLQDAVRKAQLQGVALHQISTTVREATVAQMRQQDLQKSLAKTGQEIVMLANLMENPELLRSYLASNGIALNVNESADYIQKQSKETEEFDAENFFKGEDLPPETEMTAKDWATLTQEITKRYSN